MIAKYLGRLKVVLKGFAEHSSSGTQFMPVQGGNRRSL